MATADYTPDCLATLAHETARHLGCQALRWWQDSYDPRRLFIEVSYTLSNGQPFPVWISTPIPGSGENSRQAEPPRARRAEPSRGLS